MDPIVPENKKDQNTNQDGTIIEPLRTYEQDVRNVVASQNISVVKMALAQGRRQEAQEKVEENASPRSKRNILIISISAILVIAAIAAIGGTYYFLDFAKNSLASLPGSTATFISTDSSHTIILNGDTKQELSQKIVAEADSLPNGLIEQVFFQESGSSSTSTISTNDFLSIIKAQAPAALVRSLYPQFAFGFYGKNRVPFMIFETNSYDQAYAGMLAWEPNMRTDFENILFSSEFENTLPASTITQTSTVATVAASSTATGSSTATSATTTTADTSAATAQAITVKQPVIPFPASFKDLVVSNKDARALYNRDGQLLVLYGFVDKEYIVITRDPDALNEIYDRLRQNEISR